MWHKRNLPDLSNWVTFVWSEWSVVVLTAGRATAAKWCWYSCDDQPRQARTSPPLSQISQCPEKQVPSRLMTWQLNILRIVTKSTLGSRRQVWMGLKKSDLEVVRADSWSLSFVILKLNQFQVLKVCLVLLFYDSLEKCKIEIWINKTNTKIFLTWSQRYSHTKNDWMQ